MITWKTALNFLAGAWDYVCCYAMEIAMGAFALLIVACFATLLVVANQEDNDRETRLEYCYKQGYVEVIESKHDPRYYCFDARLDPVAFRSIPSKVWEDE